MARPAALISSRGVMETVARLDVAFAEPWFEHGLHDGDCVERSRVREGDLERAIPARGDAGNRAVSETEPRAKMRNEITQYEAVPANHPQRIIATRPTPRGSRSTIRISWGAEAGV